MRKRILTWVVIFSMMATTAEAANFYALGHLAIDQSGFTYSHAFGVSADGSVVVGRSYNGTGAEAFRWTSTGGMVGIGYLPGGGYESFANGTSSDGSVIVGVSDSSVGSGRAFRWTNEGMIKLGDGTGGSRYTTALGVSSDGAVAVGYRSTGGDPVGLGIEAFRWTVTDGMQGLGDLEGGVAYSLATSASSNGSIIVGGGESALGREAFRWTSADGMVGLGDLPGAGTQSIANSVTPDGAIIVGEGLSSAGLEGFRWTEATGMIGLGFLTDNPYYSYSTALDVSDDGSVIIGLGWFDSQTDQAAVWTEGTGWRRLYDVLLENGASGMAGWTLSKASAISADGQWISGWGRNPNGQEEAFVANINPVPIPSAVWLIAPAFGLLAPWVKRRAKSAA